MKSEQNRIARRGWRIIAAGFLLIGLSVGVGVNSNSAMLGPVCEGLGFKVGAFAVTASISAFAAIPCYVIIPRLLKRLSMKAFVLISGLVFVLSKLGFGLSGALWQFCVCALGMGLSTPGVSYIAVNSLINREVSAGRNTAVGIAASGAGLVGAIFLPILTGVVGAHGWRAGYFLQAATCAFMLAAALFLMKDVPSGVSRTSSPQSVDPSGTGYTLRQALGMPSFYLLLLAVFLLILVNMGVQPYLIAYLEDAGYAPAFAAGCASALLIVVTFGKILMGAAFDRVGAKAAGLITGAIMAASLFLLLMSAQGRIWAYGFTAVFGVAYASISIPPAYFTTELFGTLDFTAVYGVVMVLSALGSTAGNLMTGVIHDSLGNYSAAWWIYMAVSALVSVLLTASCALIACKKRTV